MLDERTKRILDLPEFRDFISRLGQRGGNQNTQVDQDLQRIREAHTREEVERALEWVLEAFRELIRPEPGTGDPMVYFASFTNNQEAKERGWCMSGNGHFIHTRSILAERLALYYIDVILDDSIEDDRDKIRAMIENSRNRIPPRPLEHEEIAPRSPYPLHPGLLFLEGQDGEIEMWIHGDKADEV